MKAINFEKAPKKVIGLDALTKSETTKQLKENIKLPYKREMKGLYNEGKVIAERLYWIYDSTAPVYFTKHGELLSFYKKNGAPTNEAFYVGVPKKAQGYHSHKRSVKGVGGKPTDGMSAAVYSMERELEIINAKLDLIVEMLSMGSKSTNGDSLTVTKGDVTIKF